MTDNENYLRKLGKIRQPTILLATQELRPANAVPYTSEPMSKQNKYQDEQNQHGRSILEIVVEFSYHSA